MKSSGIGGQAVLEGVMMKHGNRYAVAVRKPDKQIEIKIDEYKGIRDKIPFFRLPVLRGIAAFVESLVLGIRTLTYSSSFYEEESTENKKEVSKAKETLTDIGVVGLSILMAVAIFVLLPLFLSQLLGQFIKSDTLQLAMEGVLRIVMFIAYVALISKMNDIKRVFMYHGAEHKCINCVENGEELTVVNVRKQSRCHKRCGTSFMLVVMLVSFVLFMFIRVDAVWLRYILRIILIPVIAGISFEFIQLAGNSENKLVNILSRPGLWMQGLTTREPDDSMIKVAITSVEAVFDWRAYQEKEGIAKYKKLTAKKEAKKSNGKKKVSGKTQKDISPAIIKEAVTTERIAAEHVSAEDDFAAAEEFSSLDKVLDFSAAASTAADEKNRREQPLEEAVAAKERQQGLKNKVRAGHDSEIIQEMAAPNEEEEDEVLRALDKFFVYKGDKADADAKK